MLQRCISYRRVEEKLKSPSPYLLYSRYGSFTHWIMRTIIRSKGGPDTDTSRDYVYTDWDQVRGFTESFLRSASELQPRSEIASRAMRRSSSVGIT